MNNNLCDDARQLVFNVLLFCEQEAVQFKKKENGYFQRVYARVSKACCVSENFLRILVKEKRFYEKYTPRPIGQVIAPVRKSVGPRQDRSSKTKGSRAKVIKIGAVPAPTPAATPAAIPTVALYSQLEPPPLVPITKRTKSPATAPPPPEPTPTEPTLPEPPTPIAANLEVILPPIVNTLDALLPPIINNLSELPPLVPSAQLPMSPDLSLLGASPDRYTPELFIDEDRIMNYSDDEDISYDQMPYGFNEQMICEFHNNGGA